MDDSIWFAKVDPSNGATEGYISLGGVGTSGPGSGANGSRTAVAVRGLDNAIHINWSN